MSLCGAVAAAEPDEPATEPAAAEAEPKPATPKPEPSAEAKGGSEPADERFGHAMQLGLRAGITGGYRVIFRYDRSPFCRTRDFTKADKDQQKFCGGGAPAALDLALSFGLLDFLEPYAWARFGFTGEAGTNTKALTAFGVGARIYTMSDSKLKIFVDPGIGMEVEGGVGNAAWKFSDGSSPDYKSDFLFHLGVGPQYDFARAFGIYANAGLTTGVLRYIHTELEISGGVQVRVP
ncbi:MAG TPA: hypothetical protein VEQ58_09690 [Polyangiaceae bacterium]|nr:hypothetical protein [Polyangiaceae bacterium]